MITLKQLRIKGKPDQLRSQKRRRKKISKNKNNVKSDSKNNTLVKKHPHQYWKVKQLKKTVKEKNNYEMDIDIKTAVAMLLNKSQPRLKKRKKKKKKKSNCKTNCDFSLMPQFMLDAPAELKIYWKNKYRKRTQLFSKFDEGIKLLDPESWYSTTPEVIANEIAERCECNVIIDAFCGAGGNTIAFAKTCKRVIAIDIHPKKIEMAKHNAKIYGVEDNIEFIVGDFLQLSDKLFGDVVFLSPPWGGPGYSEVTTFDIKDVFAPLGGVELFKISQKISNNIAYYLPKNIDVIQTKKIIDSKVNYIEDNFLEDNKPKDRLKAKTFYYGNLAKKKKSKSKKDSPQQ